MLPRPSLGYINLVHWARFISRRPASPSTTSLQDLSPPRLCLLLAPGCSCPDENRPSCCASSKWPLARRSQHCLPCRDLALQEAPDATRKSACPAVTVPTKRHQAPSASPLVQLSPSPPRGTRHHSQVRLSLSWSPSSSSLTGAVTVRHKLVLPPTVQLLYATSWYCHKCCSYCTPQAGTATN